MTASGPDGSDKGSGERPPESAAFETARVGGPRRARSPLVASAFMLVLVLVVAAGVIGRLSAGPFPIDVAAASPTPIPPPLETILPRPVVPAPPGRGLPPFPVDTGAMLTSGPGDLELLAKRNAQTVFVHGDVYSPGVTWVFMSLRDNAGQVAGWASVSVPGAAGPAASGVPTLRFDVELAIPATFTGDLWVQAHAYDAQFGLVATARVDTPVAAP